MGSDSPLPADLGPAERWIEVSLQEQMVRLHVSDPLWRISCRYGCKHSAETTLSGLIRVRHKYKGPIETAPDTYVRDVLEFDLEHGNGFHSLPMDARGHVLDDRVGTPVTAGCVRVAESTAVYDFATLGMKVWIH
jgi:hypothetical protein